MAANTIRVGIIGTGSRGITCIGRQIAEQSGELDITISAFCNRTENRMHVALQDVNEIAANSGNRTFSPAFYSDSMDLISDNNVDTIVITTPTAAHLEAAIPALRSGKKVYLDKPLRYECARLPNSFKPLHPTGSLQPGHGLGRGQPDLGPSLGNSIF